MHSAVDLAHLIRRAGIRYPDQGVIEDGRTKITLAAAIDRAERLANALDEMGISPHGRVAILSENRTEFVEIDFGLLLARRVRVALNARLHVDDFEYMLAAAEVELLIHSGGFAETAASLAERTGVRTLDLDDGYTELLEDSEPTAVRRAGDEEDTAWISFTSGTTGRPKGVVLSRRGLRHVGQNLLLELDDVRPGEQHILSQPLSHGAGYFILPYLLSGAGLVIQQKFDAEAIGHAAKRPEVRTVKVVPAMIPQLLDLPEPLQLESIIYGGAPIATPLLEASLDRFGPVLMQIYGQSEAPMTLTVLHREHHLGSDEQRRSAGQAWRSIALEVRDAEGAPLGPNEIGELYVSGDHLMTGYLNQPETTAEVLDRGWLGTRDMAYIDTDGFVFLMGRLDDMIISGGFNIAPREIEVVVLEHPAIDECVVFGVDDKRWGSAVHAAVVYNKAIGDEELIDWLRPRLGFRTPKRVLPIDEIPRNAYGKLDRAALLSRFPNIHGRSDTAPTSSQPGGVGSSEQ